MYSGYFYILCTLLVFSEETAIDRRLSNVLSTEDDSKANTIQNNETSQDGLFNLLQESSTFSLTESTILPMFSETNIDEERETLKPHFPLVLNPNVTHEELTSSPNRGFWDWFNGIFNGNNAEPSIASTQIKPPSNCPPCTCGLTNVMQRIIGGVVTKINQYPWMVALKFNNRFFCGGSLINSRYILTAGHCTVGIAKERLVAVFLEHDRTDPGETTTITKKVIGIYRHKSYNMGGSYNNDIALLKLEDDVQFSSNLRPVCLPTVGRSFTGMIGTVTGWGATQEYGQSSTKLREVKVPIISNEECLKTKYGNKITVNMLCAGYVKEGGKDACQGDSGGPLHVVNGTHNMVVGVVSWGEGCAEEDYPGVYTRVNRYITWIKTNTRDGCYCQSAKI